MDHPKTKAEPGIGSRLFQKLRNAYAWLIIPGLLVIFVGVNILARIPATWVFVGDHYSQIYYTTKVTTAVACFIYGVVILVLNRNATPSPEKWLSYIGWAFVMLFAMYSFSFLLEAIDFSQHNSWLDHVIFTGLSALNNLLFFGAALKLVDRDPFPRWNMAIQGLAWALGNLLFALKAPYDRFPDALSSGFCILWLGRALYLNIHQPASPIGNVGFLSSSLRGDFGKAVLIGTTAYVALGIAFSLNPIIASYQWGGKHNSIQIIARAVDKRVESLQKVNGKSDADRTTELV